MLGEDIKEVIKNNNFKINDEEVFNDAEYVYINTGTPLGEDWQEVIEYDGTDRGFIDEFRELVLSFDPDKEVEFLVVERGRKGIPLSIRDLLEDAEWKKEQLENLLEDLEQLGI